MDKCNSDFLFGMLIATIIIGVIMFFKGIISADIEDRKVEHLTITYKNSECGIADKEMLVNIMKQHFPSSNWSYVDTKAGKNYVELDVWSADKK